MMNPLVGRSNPLAVLAHENGSMAPFSCRKRNGVHAGLAASQLVAGELLQGLDQSVVPLVAETPGL